MFDSSFYTALYAKGRLKENALISPFIGFIMFPIIFLMFKAGFSPVVLSYAGIISYALLGLIIKPVLICKIANYSFKEITSVFIPCLLVSLVSVPIPILCNIFLEKNLVNYFLILAISIICVIVAVFFIGIDRQMRGKIVCFVKDNIIKQK